MRKLRYISSDYFSHLTQGKVYDIVDNILHSLNHNDKITIIDDTDTEVYIFMYDSNGIQLFEDITAEFRSEVINEILN